MIERWTYHERTKSVMPDPGGQWVRYKDIESLLLLRGDLKIDATKPHPSKTNRGDLCWVNRRTGDWELAYFQSWDRVNVDFIVVVLISGEITYIADLGMSIISFSPEKPTKESNYNEKGVDESVDDSSGEYA